MIRITPSIRNVIVYAGSGCYADGIGKQKTLFEKLNEARAFKWKVSLVKGHKLSDSLTESNPKETLLVIPAGEASKIEDMFIQDQTIESINDFVLKKGGSLLGTCGVAYGLAFEREFQDTIKFSRLPLFQGKAQGPLSFSIEPVKVTNGNQECSFLLDRGGSFRPFPEADRVKILLKYLNPELQRFGKSQEDWENAAVLAKMGNGSVVFTMPHLEYGPKDIDADALETNFPNSANWKKLKDALDLDAQLRLIHQSIIGPLEDSLLIDGSEDEIFC